MNTDKTLFAQLMGFFCHGRFSRYVERYDGNKGATTLNCAEQFHVMSLTEQVG
ncbi:MAG: hypothetical protein BWY57_00776 [Betaproteobacteria bacterium ADurb.Bin341]|nr:MAG: hypothetical protein BWY57_00776 [Betaproteobacteria bacterium ADurb.Bin341]